MEYASDILYESAFIVFLLIGVKWSRVDLKEWLQGVKYRSLIALFLGFNLLGLVFSVAAKMALQSIP